MEVEFDRWTFTAGVILGRPQWEGKNNFFCLVAIYLLFFLFQIVDAFDKAIEIFNKNGERQPEVPEIAAVTEIPPSSFTTSRTQENTTAEEFIENSLPLKEKIPRV